MWRGRRRGTEAGKPGDGGWGAGGGLSPAGWPGCPGVPWGRRLPTSGGCETTSCVSVTEVLRVLPQELTRRGDCGPGRPRGMTMKRKWGARMSRAVGTFPGLGEAVARGYSLPPVAAVLWWVVVLLPPNGCLCPVPWVQTPVGGGYEAPGRPATPAQQPGRRRSAFIASCRGGGGGARGSAGPLRPLGGPHCPYNATWGRAGSYRTRGPRRPSRGGGGGGQGGDRGGVRGSRQVDGGWRGLVPRTGGPHHPPVGRRSCRGSRGATQGPSAPAVRFRCGGGEAKATCGHGTWHIGREV